MRLLAKIFKASLATFMLLHFLGATQVLAATLKDQASFKSMMTMVEEENKKEKEDKEETAEWQAYAQSYSETYTSIAHFDIQSAYISHIQSVTPQFITDQPTPPPDFLI
ncbi:MAG: hypothetical protein JST49_07660 [Bacteroidetes bacterium]|nr:hypothetical protein [Bacteroidota bacterium]